MDQWAEIRRRMSTAGVGKREACRQYDVHWLAPKKILTPEEPPGYRRVAPPQRPAIEPAPPVIRRIPGDESKAPKKQRHTARRIWQRLKAEYGFTGGYLSFSRTGAELLIQVFADRYERRSLLITSNLPFGEWGTVFQGERMTAALLDRLSGEP